MYGSLNGGNDLLIVLDSYPIAFVIYVITYCQAHFVYILVECVSFNHLNGNKGDEITVYVNTVRFMTAK